MENCDLEPTTLDGLHWGLFHEYMEELLSHEHSLAGTMARTQLHARQVIRAVVCILSSVCI